MSNSLIIKATSIITMDPAKPRAEAVAVDLKTGVITAVGSYADVSASHPDAHVHDLPLLQGSEVVLMPGFIDPHSHPLVGGMVTQDPAYWIAPYVKDATGTAPYATFEQVKEFWKRLDVTLDAGKPVICNGLDRLLQGAPELDNETLDEFFPSRPAVILDNSGHEAYFNSTVILNNWPDRKPPEDPPGSSYGRKEDGTSNGRASEAAAIQTAVKGVIDAAITNPLLSGARWYKLMAENGVTMTTEHAYSSDLLDGYITLADAANSPLRLALYHMSIEDSCADKVTTPLPEARLWKQGIKLWADGSPWVGTIAASFPYLDTPPVRAAQIPPGVPGPKSLNYTRAELDGILDKYTPSGWQFSFHCNGDIGLDVVLDAYARALANHGLLGTDHRWRVEHCGGCRGDQFARAAALGVTISLSPFQFIYWGDLLDGKMFSSEIGSQWVRAGEAMKSGTPVSFHNDGCVSPPIPLLNIQSMVTRRTPTGTVRGPEQAVTLHDALKAHTTYAAYQLRRDHDLGSITVGKLADFVELSADPYTVDIEKLTDQVKVLGTWSNGKRIDLEAFLLEIQGMPPGEHRRLAGHALHKRCC